ncbi:YadA-like family protein [Pseudoxanthomonas sp. Root630]|uniref:YadA-like family protein n=1 Tax=Pseudoxanthomonas sp. Root630 TaxID=1736574 RepID=UPI0007031A28|nr:YadA-like family protein [Pseudoxanthomonas sp. Root630]KRA45111.1 hypothetical protein ASD72_07535 [Pseudoxanthomonas sp. Root630]
MNRIYSKVWSRALGAWVVASEFAKQAGAGGTARTPRIGHGLQRAALAWAVLVALGAMPLAALAYDGVCVDPVSGTPVGTPGPVGVACGDDAVATAPWTVVIGYQSRALGESDIAVGHRAGYGSTGAAGRNAYFGAEAGIQNSGYINLAVGTQAGANVSGMQNVAVGYNAGLYMSGNANVAIGANAGAGNRSAWLYAGANLTVSLGAGSGGLTDGSVALGAGSIADRAAGVAGYDPLTSLASTSTSTTWTSTRGAVSVGSAIPGWGIASRQITGVAAGSADSDAVNVAQLVAAQAAATTHYFSVNSTGTVPGSNYANDGAVGIDAIAIGMNAYAPGGQSTVVGTLAGNLSSGGGLNAFFGYRAGQSNSGSNNVAMGPTSGATVSGHLNVGIGVNAGNNIAGNGNVSIGPWSGPAFLDPARGNVNHSVSLGTFATATTDYSVALGAYSIADRAAGVAGYDPLTGLASTATSTTWVSTRGAVSVGSGFDSRQITGVAAGSADSDAVNVAQLVAASTHYYSVNDGGAAGGNYYNDGATGIYALAAGVGASAARNFTVAIGYQAVSNGRESISMGTQAVSEGDSEIHLGTQAGAGGVASNRVNIGIGTRAGQNVDGIANTAVGWNAGSDVTGEANLALGKLVGSNVTGNGNIALGEWSGRDVTGSFNFAMGRDAGNGVTASNTVAVGTRARASQEGGIALGRDAAASVVDGVALGAGSVADTGAGIAGFVPTGAGAAQIAAINATTGTLGAVSVGGNGQFRQITGVAAGTDNDDAVNVAQLRAVEATANAGWNVTDASGAAASIGPNGTVTFESGNTNIAVNQTGVDDDGVVDITLSNDLDLTAAGSLTVGGTVVNNAGVAVGTNVALGNAGLTVIGGTTTVVDASGLTTGNVALSGVSNDVTGLSNRTLGDATFATIGRAATEEQLQLMQDEIIDGLAPPTRYYGVNSVGGGNEAGEGAIGEDAIALGMDAESEGDDAISVGHGATASGTYSLALGADAQALSLNALAIGAGAMASHENSIALGAGSATTVGARSGYQGAYVGSSNSTGEMNIGGRQITGVAAGSAATDAVNVSQLEGGVTYAINEANSYTDSQITNLDTRMTTIEGDLVDIRGDITDIQGDIVRIEGDITNLDTRVGDVEGDVANLTTTVNQFDNRVTDLERGGSGPFQVTQGETYVAPTPTGTNASAGGNGAVASGDNSTALGNQSVASGDNSTALGQGATASHDNSVALGRGSATTVGAQRGYTAAYVGRSNSTGEVNVGGRTISGVAPGIAGTDAVNVNQLDAGVDYAIDQANAYTDSRFNRFDGDMWNLERGYRGGTASAMAMAGLPQAYLPGKSMVSVAFGGYQGEYGMAFGLSTITDNGRWVYRAQATGNTTRDWGFSVGAGLQW